MKLSKFLLLLPLLGGMLVGCNTAPKEKGYTVTFETYGGTSVETMENVTQVYASPVTTKEDFVFGGWYLSSTYETAVTFPYVVTEDMTMHAKWDALPYSVVGEEFVYAITPTGKATAYMSAEHKEDHLEVLVEVEDAIIYNYLTNAPGMGLNGMNDNVELFVASTNYAVFGMQAKETYKILTIPGVGYEINQVLSGNGNYRDGVNYSGNLTNTGIVVENNILIEEDGFSGYVVTFKVPYSLFGLTRETAPKNIALYLAMRNTNDASVSGTAYIESAYKGCERANVWTYPVVDENNDFTFNPIETLFIGDSYTDLNWYRVLNTDFAGKNFYGRGIGGSKVPYWTSVASTFVQYQPKNIVIHIGVNDIDTGDTNGAPTFQSLTTFVNTVHSLLPTTKIYWMTICDNVRTSFHANGVHKFTDAYHYVNEQMKLLAASDEYLEIIDFAAEIDGSDEIISFLDEGLHLNAFGYNQMTKCIYEALGYDYEVGTLIGSSGADFHTSRGFDLSDDENNIISTTGQFDQIAFFKSESGSDQLTVSADLTALQVNNGDLYPKMGLILATRTKLLFFYVDMYANLDGQVVGYVFNDLKSGGGVNYDWATSVSETVSDISYTGSNSVSMKLEVTDSAINMYVNNNLEFGIARTVLGDTVHAGLLSFNTAFTAKNLSYTEI